ncbi:hypothetical protein MJG53_016776 [Ovis ammon polii x Ovis aries]|uniref:Uncharacterized protein n=1 Tax=Ovis ammon polii x Ovis aries TaxID=2918886 RepID=A0ACB9U9M3_9CETA|nr:hypothetical protein MJG53_016776 [Ovis ammon polii x Ovis aries]
MAAYKMVLIWHSESAWNLENRFSGWYDTDLSPAGREEVKQGGQALRDAGYECDICFTSVQKRAIRTLWTALGAIDQMWLPVVRTWRLNERHYGGLTGLNKAETAAKHGEAQIEEGKWVLIAAHGNSLRGIVKHLEGLSEEAIMELNLPTGIPMGYELDKNLKPIKPMQFLGDEETVRKAMEAVSAQGKAKNSMNPTTSAGPMANSVFVVTPPNGYTVFPGGMSQVPVYPNYQSQVQFIISGSLSVLAEKHSPSSCLLNSSVGFNIVSAVFSMIGIALLIVDLIITAPYSYPVYNPHYAPWGAAPGMAISGLLLIFCLLEVCVASASAHFGCQLTCYRTNNVGVVIPNVYVTNPVVNPEPENSPPNYSEHLSIMTEQGVEVNAVPGGMAPSNVYVIQARNPVAPGSKGQPVGMATYLTSRVTESDAGRANLQTPRVVIQNPAEVNATQGLPTVLQLQHPTAVASMQTPPGEIQYSLGTTNLQTLPGGPQNPPTCAPGPMYTPNQFQWNMPFGSFFTFDPKKFIKDEVRTLGAIQILIGLTHIFTAINPSLYWQKSYSVISGYLAWGGVSVHGSIGMNVVSAIVSLAGILLLILDLCFTQSNRTEVPTVVIANPANTPTGPFNVTDNTTGQANVITSPANPTSPTNAAVMVPPVPS